MTVICWLVTCLVAIAAVLFIRSGFGEWRTGDNYRPLSPRYGLLVDKRVSAGYSRSMLIIGLGCGFMAMMMADVLVVELADPGKAETVIFVVATAGMILSCVLALSIIGFNRPKFLVPPRHRAERGAFTPNTPRRPGRKGRS